MNKLLLFVLLGLTACGETENYTVDTTELENRIIQLEDGAVLAQTELNEMQQRLIELETNENIVQFIDPCGDDEGNYDEIIMRTSQNKLIAFFQQGVRRYLTILEPGYYTTTDRQRCHFTVTESMDVF